MGEDGHQVGNLNLEVIRLKKHAKLLVTLCVKYSIAAIYFLSSHLFPVNKRKVTFASYRSSHLKDNLLSVYNEICRRDESLTFVFLLKRFDSAFLEKCFYVFHLFRASYHLATSRYFIIDDYYFPVYVIRPRAGTEIIQLWHAAGAFKKFGYSTVGKSFGPSPDYLRHVKVHSNYSKVIVSGAEVIPYYSEAFNMPADRILPLGVPRDDLYFEETQIQKKVRHFFNDYPELSGKKLILYAPTFRGRSHGQHSERCPLDLKRFAGCLADDCVLIVHLHPYAYDKMAPLFTSEKVYLIQETYDIQDLMIVSDMLITDYSSVIFDYSLLEKPIAFYAEDLDRYIQERDFYYDFKSFIPGPFFTDMESLAEWINRPVHDTASVIAFKHHFFDHLDGQASKRIVDQLFYSISGNGGQMSSV